MCLFVRVWVCTLTRFIPTIITRIRRDCFTCGSWSNEGGSIGCWPEWIMAVLSLYISIRQKENMCVYVCVCVSWYLSSINARPRTTIERNSKEKKTTNSKLFLYFSLPIQVKGKKNAEKKQKNEKENGKSCELSDRNKKVENVVF